MDGFDAGWAPWPPAFSATFVTEARRRFTETDHVMIVGAVGSGRSTLAAEIAGPAVPTAWGRDTPLAGEPAGRYAALNHLLPTLRAREQDSVAEVVAAAETIVARSFGRQTFVLREADLTDVGTIDVLAQLVEAGRIALVSTLGPAAASTHRFARSATRIDLPPLDDATIAHLLQSRFGAVPHPTTVTMLAGRSQGAYGIVKVLADAAVRTGQLRVLAGNLVTDASVTIETVDAAAGSDAAKWPARAAAGDVAHDLIDVGALTTAIDLDEARSAFGSQAVDAAILSGAMHPDGTSLVFTSHVEALTIRRDLTAQRREALFDRYQPQLPVTTSLAGAATHVASWVLSVDRPLSADLAVRAATRANRECRYALALRFISAIPAAERPSRLLVEQCHALDESGADQELDALLEDIDPAALHDDDLFPYLRWCSSRSTPDQMAEIMASLERRAVEDCDEARRAVLTLATLSAAVYHRGSDDLRHALAALSMSGRLSPVNQAMAQVALANFLRHASRAEQADRVATAAVALLLEDGDAASACNVGKAMETQILCRISSGDLEAAREALTAYSAPGLPYGNLGRLGNALWGFVAFFGGDISAAIAQAQLCLARIPPSDPHEIRGWVEAMTAQVLVQAGDIDQVYELLESSYRHPPGRRPQLVLESKITQACVHDAIGQPEEALEILQGIVEEARERELKLEEVDAAVLCVQIGGPLHLGPLLEAVKDVDETSGTSAIWQRFAWAVRDNDMRALVRLAEELDRLGRQVFASEIAQFTLDIARRAADMTPDQRRRLGEIADPMQHRHVTRA